MTKRNYVALRSRKIDEKNASTVHLLHFFAALRSMILSPRKEHRFPLLFKSQIQTDSVSSPNRSRNDNSNWSRNITFLVDCRFGGKVGAGSGAPTGVAIRDSFIHEHFSMDRPYVNDSFHVLKAGRSRCMFSNGVTDPCEVCLTF